MTFCFYIINYNTQICVTATTISIHTSSITHPKIILHCPFVITLSLKPNLSVTTLFIITILPFGECYVNRIIIYVTFGD